MTFQSNRGKIKHPSRFVMRVLYSCSHFAHVYSILVEARRKILVFRSSTYMEFIIPILPYHYSISSYNYIGGDF